MTNFDKDDKYFIFPGSCARVYERLEKQDISLAFEYMKAIMDYGFERKKPDEDSPLWIYGLECAFSLIDSSQEKEAATLSKNKDKEKRKAEDKKLNKMNKLDLEKIASLVLQNYTQQEIGEKLGISQQIVSYRLGVIRLEYPELLNKANKKIENS